jgi:hypothetical protein
VWLIDKHIQFAHPVFFGLLLLIPMYLWYIYRNKVSAAIPVTTIQGMEKIKYPARERWRWILHLWRVASIVALSIAMARPQKSDVIEEMQSEGIDIVLSMDISGSMLAEDLKPNRIEAAKKVAKEFIENRPTDRIGLVIFPVKALRNVP